MRLRLEVSLEFERTYECVGQPARKPWLRHLGDLVTRSGVLLRAALCRIGFHRMVMDEERSCCWGGIDRCTRCGTEERWSNSYR